VNDINSNARRILAVAVALAWSLCFAVAPGAVATPQTVSLVDAPTMGSSLAKVVIVEYSDFHCPFCRRFVRETLPQIKREYVDAGKVLYAFRNFPLTIHPQAPEAAIAALCGARQDKFWLLHDRFFSAPRPVQPADLEGHAKAVGMDVARFRTCVKGIARNDVRTDADEARRLGFAGTPGFLIGLNEGDERMRPVHRLVGFEPFATFKAVLDPLVSRR
jgi:protein-disulfide isomerase